MCHHLNTTSPTAEDGLKAHLTERNLRLHVASHQKASQQGEKQSHAAAPPAHKQNELNDGSSSDDEDLDAMRDVALKRAASLEALQAYGGCFVSGFLAMQDPLPWLSPAASPTTSDSSDMSTGSPRPDSDTLSQADVRELSGEGDWSRRRMRKVARRSRS
ncbi:hypothetical protein BDU57DRAFT_514072 [Ampelomyces quisqualis]|uniref:Uncharacterized protein n=1 Tax=Ampelomyces quisqualis TaxID=50730 RepID=A0A6A5QQM4_AMPQU|nr:hypothetical protein BDU57DRAFT_514072 [Ampelomyces quisqualis]